MELSQSAADKGKLFIKTQITSNNNLQYSDLGGKREVAGRLLLVGLVVQPTLKVAGARSRSGVLKPRKTVAFIALELSFAAKYIVFALLFAH